MPRLRFNLSNINIERILCWKIQLLKHILPRGWIYELNSVEENRVKELDVALLPVTTAATTELRMKPVARLNTANPWMRLSQLTNKVPSEDILADSNPALLSIHTATVILLLLG